MTRYETHLWQDPKNEERFVAEKPVMITENDEAVLIFHYKTKAEHDKKSEGEA